MKLKKYISFFMVLLCLFPAAALVANYDLQASGMTNEAIVKSRIGLPETAEYDSPEAMQKKDLSYKQTLDNMRIFKSVDIVYTQVSENEFNVLFDIKSALTFIMLPYPKYDSNYGISVKLKILDTNFLGTLGSLDVSSVMTQSNNGNGGLLDFEDSLFDTDGSLSGLKFGSVSISGTIDSNIYYTNDEALKKKNYLKAGISVSGIKAGKLTMSLGANTNLNFAEIKGSTAGMQIGLSGFKMGNVSMSLGANTNLNFAEINGSTAGMQIGLSGFKMGNVSMSATFDSRFGFNGFKGSEAGLKASLSGVKLGKTPVSLSPYLYFEVIDEATKKTVPSRAGISASFSVNKHSFTGSYASYFLNDTHDERTIDDPYETASFSGSYAFGHGITPSATLSFDKYLDSPWYKASHDFDFFKSVTLSEALSFKVGPVSCSLGQSNTTDFTAGTHSENVTFGASYSTGTINYVKGDFRKGFKFSVSANAQYYFNKEWKETDDNHVRSHLEFTWFPFAGDYFNPNLRIIASVSDKMLGKIKQLGSGYGFIYDQSIYMAEYLRGIRNLDAKSMAVSAYNAAAILNVNLPVRAEKDFSAIRFYFNPFFDGAVLYNFEDNDLKYFAGAGLEVTGIMSAYPSYPIRVSMGFDLDTVSKFLHKEELTNSIFELYIGLYHFY